MKFKFFHAMVNNRQRPIIEDSDCGDLALTAGEYYCLEIKVIGTSEPTVSRSLCVPAYLTFHEFHEKIQIAFGWANTSDYQFNISLPWVWDTDEPYTPGATTEHHYGDNPLRDIKYIMQKKPSMDSWRRSRFEPSRQRRIHEAFHSRGQGKHLVEFWYIYGLNPPDGDGDGFSHRIIVRDRGVLQHVRAQYPPPDDQLPEGSRGENGWCFDGEGHPIADPCSGPRAWDQIKRHCLRPSKSKLSIRPVENPHERCEHDVIMTRKWFARTCPNGHGLWPNGLDASRWDMAEVNRRMTQNIVQPPQPPEEESHGARIKSFFRRVFRMG